MKKTIISMILAIFLSVFAIFAVFNVKNISYAEIDNTSQIKQTIANNILGIINFDERIAGSEDEKSTSEYIKNFLDDYTEAIPVQNQSTENGVQKFSFQSIFDENYYYSQNIIYYLPAAIETTQKVIISCHYDSYAYKLDSYGNILLEATQAVNQSAGSTALLMVMAKYLKKNTYNFNIEFVFFGASSSNNAGMTFYTNGIDEDGAKNILLAINLDTIAFGKNLYFYVDEIETEISKYSKEIFEEADINIDEINIINIAKDIVDDNGMGLTYTHIAQKPIINFMKVGVLAMNIFAGEYNSGITVGRCEFYGEDVITYTQKDNMEFIMQNYDSNIIITNLTEVFAGITNLIESDDFVVVCSTSFGETSTFYSIFGNKNLVILLTIILLIIFLIISFVIHYNLTVKSYNTNIEDDFVAVVLNMAANIEKKSSDEVTKKISEIIASDIKKDKRIRKK